MEKEAIKHLQDDAVIDAINQVLIENDADLLALPESARLEDLEQYSDRRRRFRGTFATNDPKGFANYCVTNVTETIKSACFIDPEQMAALTILDLGTVNAPLHADHKATLSLQKTAAFKALLQIEGKRMDQKSAAEWLEDWAPHLAATIRGEDGPEFYPLSKAIAAVRLVTLKTNTEQEHEDRDYGATRSTMASVEAKSRDQPLPNFLEFTCNPYHGLPERTFRLRIALITSDGDPEFRFRMVQAEQEQEEMADDFADLIRQEMGGVMDVTIGRMTA